MWLGGAVVRSWLGPQQVEKQEQASIASVIEGANLRKINPSPYFMCQSAKAAHANPNVVASFLLACVMDTAQLSLLF